MKYSFAICKRSKLWFLISALIILPGIFSIIVQGFNLGVDFTGGALLDVQFKQPVTVAEVRTALQTVNLEQSVIQLVASEQTDSSPNVLIRTRILTEPERRGMIEALTGTIGEAEILRNEMVGAIIGGELTRNAVVALLAASLLMMVYIAYRFDFKFSVCCIVSLFHDALVVIGCFSLLQIEIDGTFIAALLTVIGYSINDTIVIFDRIRENLRRQRRDESIEELVDRSIWQTMTRSIYTALTVLFSSLALYVFGGESTRHFALAMLVGIFCGAYSSIFTASPLWALWRNRERRQAASRS